MRGGGRAHAWLALAVALLLVGAVGRRQRLRARRATATTSSTARSCSSRSCGSCHTLARAGTKGVSGPEPRPGLPAALARRLRAQHDRGHRPPPDPAPEPACRRSTRRPASGCRRCRPSLVTGEDAEDVAAYVADVGRQAGQGHRAAGARSAPAGRQGHAQEQDGTLDDPGRPHRRARLQVQGRRRRRRGAGQDRLQEHASIDHDIAVEGNGVDEKGEVVKNGGTSKVDGRPQARRVHVLLLRARPPRGRHGGQAHRQVGARGSAAPARARSPRRDVVLARARQKKHSEREPTMIMMSSATMIAAGRLLVGAPGQAVAVAAAVDARVDRVRGTGRSPSPGTSPIIRAPKM